MQAVTINYHHTTGSRAPSLDDDEEEEDRLHAMISMICSRNLTDPNVMKGFYHLNTPTQPHRPPLPRPHSGFRRPSLPPTPSCPLRPSPVPPPTHLTQLRLPVCVLPEAKPNSGVGWSWMYEQGNDASAEQSNTEKRSCFKIFLMT